MARESELWQWMKRYAPDYAPQLHLSRVENLVEKAWPDIEGCYDGHGFQLETKVLKGIRKDGSGGSIRFEPGQREWLARRWEARGRAFVLIQGHAEALYLVPGLLAPALPLEGVVETRDLRDMSVLPERPVYLLRRGGEEMFVALLAALVSPRLYDLARTLADARPDLAERATKNRASPVQALLSE